MVRPGGFQVGRSYAWYRSMGHNPVSAFSMRWANQLNMATLVFLAVLIGWILGGML